MAWRRMAVPEPEARHIGLALDLTRPRAPRLTSEDPGSCRGRGAVAVAAAGQLPVVVAVGRVAALAETGIVVEPGRVDLAEVQGTAERLGDPAGPAGVDGVAVAIKTLRLVRILGTCRWMSQQMSKSSPAYRPSSLRKTHSASRPAHETQVLAVIGSGSSEYGLRMPAPLFACKPARC